jgi:transcriptional regulator with XRE-family HTH domain
MENEKNNRINGNSFEVNKEKISIGQKIRELRMRKGYSQENLAEMLGMTTNGYAKIEQDKTPNLSVKRFEQIAKALDSNPQELYSLGDATTYYIGTQTGGNSGYHYVINQNMPQEFQKLQVENSHFKEKVTFLEKRIKDLEEIIDLMKK